uniref:Pentatricopeptide repeat-containing protein n=1 Tax=Tanacetum cinerariifolium TaxID=118510 RepID=A0A699HNK2_TANCI|nr:pentatricopeptide repeat-containing protein [Tanacetum cinerariifolium]
MVGEKYVSVPQFKECLTYYVLANGFSLWYEKSGEVRVVEKCGQRPHRLSDLEREYEKTIGEHYSMLRSYGKEILDSNHGSTVKLGVTMNPDGTPIFDIAAKAKLGSSSNEMCPLAMYVPELGRGSSIPIDLFTAFAFTSQSGRKGGGLWWRVVARLWLGSTSLRGVGFARVFGLGFRTYRRESQVCMPMADPFKDRKWSNVLGIKLSSFPNRMTPFRVSCSLKVLSNLHYLFSDFMDYLWSCELDISNFGPADRKILPVDGSEFHNRNLRAILTNSVVSCLTLSDQGYAEDFYDQ